MEITAPQWEQVELRFTAEGSYANPYTDLHAWAEFIHEDGTRLTRPMFWDGGRSWGCRFASTRPSGVWRYTVRSAPTDRGLEGQTGKLAAGPSRGTTRLTRHGFLRLSHKSRRNLLHADGTPFLVVGDTAWALPWRATRDQVRIYGRDRSAKGFNAALLMVVQPDMQAHGPEDRTADGGFARGFDDLPNGTLTRLRPDYFQFMDGLIEELLGHDIVPVYQPVFHGYGWKGLSVAGRVASPGDLERFQRYLIARYGAGPAIWLVGGDGDGLHPNIEAAGLTCEREDAYGQPTGIHYQPHAIPLAHHDKPWLDFQWCQTGHSGEHLPERVMQMWCASPAKAVANGEPTYEHIGAPGRAAGWWQGHEAWCNLTSGGTMGVVYGAGSLWQWRLSATEPGHQDWCHARNAGWREALDFEGSGYVGMISKILAGLDFDGMRPNWWFTYGGRGLEVPGRLYVLYREGGQGFAINSPECPKAYRVLDPRDGRELARGRLGDDVSASRAQHIALDGQGPRVVIFEVG